MDIYTPENMIRYLYNETSAEETAAIRLALETDWVLREKFDILKQSLEDLNTLYRAPRSKTLQAILRYAGITKPVNQE